MRPCRGPASRPTKKKLDKLGGGTLSWLLAINSASFHPPLPMNKHPSSRSSRVTVVVTTKAFNACIWTGIAVVYMPSKGSLDLCMLLQVRALNFSTPVFAPPVLLPTATQPANVTLGVDGSVKGEWPLSPNSPMICILCLWDWSWIKGLKLDAAPCLFKRTRRVQDHWCQRQVSLNT